MRTRSDRELAELQALSAGRPDEEEMVDGSDLGRWRRWSHRALVARAAGHAMDACEASLRAGEARSRYLGIPWW